MNIKYIGATREHPLFTTFHLMLARCRDKNRPNAKYYVGRGIKVCNRWTCREGFLNFVNDMGLKPTPKHSLDRIDVNGDYEPNNCRWATKYEQMANTTHAGKTPGVTWSRQLNKWRARIKVNGKEVSLGLYKDIKQAITARDVYFNNCVAQTISA